jgi:hypothetical protein
MNTETSRHGRSAEVAGRDALEHALLGVVPILITGYVVYQMYAGGIAAVDFQHSFWEAGWRAVHGLDPYTWTNRQISGGVSFPYPALTALVVAPFALMSSSSASIPVTAACVAAAPLSLWILRIGDWRVYGAVALWAPVVVAWQTANFTLPLVVGVSLLWRCRDRQWGGAALAACLVSIKPIMAPLWLWLVLTRRWRTAALGAMIGILLNVVSWTVLGWNEFADWLSLLSLQGSLRDGTGYSLIALAKHLGLGQQVGVALMVALGCVLVVVAGISIRAGRELRAFGAAVLLTIVVSPQIDVHYFALLLVPLALTRPRLAWPWLVPVMLWVCPATRAEVWQIVLWWALLGVLGREILAAPAAGDRSRASTGLGRLDVPGVERAGC